MAEVTEAMRRAVLAAECDAKGHDISYANTTAPVAAVDDGGAAGVAASPPAVLDVMSPDPTQLPHLVCRRCTQTWLVLPVSGWGYEDAERALYALLRPDVDTAKDIARKRGQRADRRGRRARSLRVNGDDGATSS